MATIGYKIGRFQFQGGTKTELQGSDLILLENELALERDKETGSIKMRVGDGKSKYEDCPYIDIGTISVADLTEADIAKITGPKGEPGKDLTYDMLTAEQRLELKGKPGEKGEKGDSIEVTATARNSDGSLKVTFSDGKSIDIPQGPQGKQGEPGKDGQVTFESLTADQIEAIRGPEGKQGPPGPAGKDGTNATVSPGTGLIKSGSTLSINTSYVALKSDLSSYLKPSDLTGYAKTSDIPKMVTLTQTEYDRLSYRDPNTYYFIRE